MGGHKVNGNLGKWGTHPVSHRYLEDNEISELLVSLMEANAYGEVSWFDSRISAPPLQRLPDGDHNGPPTDVCYQIRLIYTSL